ncbi:MAG: hypothetical protein JNG88_19710, partial [Phycisphaerales bacterium]|nr:hypothetical protein [Phycisphaerales bacterium]
PFVYSAADVNRDGQVNVLDTYAWDDFTGFGTGDLAVSADVNRDGSIDSADATLISDMDGWGAWGGNGRGFVSRVDSRKGYAGYEFDPATTQWHVRHRVLVSEMGRWGRRDPLGYVDGVNMYSNVYGRPIRFVDPFGLWATGECSSAWCHPPAEELPARDSRQDNRPIDCVTPEESACWDQYT